MTFNKPLLYISASVIVLAIVILAVEYRQQNRDSVVAETSPSPAATAANGLPTASASPYVYPDDSPGATASPIATSSPRITPTATPKTGNAADAALDEIVNQTMSENANSDSQHDTNNAGLTSLDLNSADFK